MGRLALREMLSQSHPAEYEVVLINDVGGDADTAAHLLQFDSIHGPLHLIGSHKLSVQPQAPGKAKIQIGGREIAYTSEGALGDCDWDGIDLVIDCTGVNRTSRSCTTNCIAPVISVLLDAFGISRSAFTTIHALTNTQRVLDGIAVRVPIAQASIDYEGEQRSAVIDAPSTVVVDGSMLKLLAWYDNETGYVARMLQLVSLVARGL